MAETSDFAKLIERLRQRDPAAADQIFRAYAHRIIALARTRLDGKIKGKVDPEDVAQSALRSFFVRHAAGQFDFTDPGGLWAVLVVITLRKCGHQIQYYRAACRDVRRENPPAMTDDSLPSWQALGREPSPSEAIRLTELVNAIMSSLDDARDRTIVELSLQGFEIPEISTKIGRSERTVQRVLARVRHRLERSLDGEDGK